MGWPQRAKYTGTVVGEPDTTPVEEAKEVDEAEETEALPDPERQARKLVALAQIRQYPDPVLRMRAREVEDFDAELEQLARRLAGLMDGADGVGLAATQVGVLRRVFVLRMSENGNVATLVNPKLVSSADELAADEEGCLSLQGVLVPVQRATSVSVAAKDVQGEDLTFELEGFEARACQHELDHLDGVLMIDRTTDDARREAMAVLRQRSVLGAHR
jgi:peptide deformylase